VHHGTTSDQHQHYSAKTGFSGFPFWLIAEGWQERKNTGRTPNPLELASRVGNRKWVEQLNYLDWLVEQARPKDSEREYPS
jgi:hypothetical protein